MKTQWHTPFHKPEIPAHNEINCSKMVLLYHPEMDIHSIGWFDYERDRWDHIADEDFEDKFLWSELPRPKKDTGNKRIRVTDPKPINVSEEISNKIRNTVYGQCVHGENMSNCDQCAGIFKENKIV